MAPRKILLPLLPSGPDGIRGFLPHGAEPPVRDQPYFIKIPAKCKKHREQIEAAAKKSAQRFFSLCAQLFLNGGEERIRTSGTLRYTCSPSKHHRPLGHLSADVENYSTEKVFLTSCVRSFSHRAKYIAHRR